VPVARTLLSAADLSARFGMSQPTIRRLARNDPEYSKALRIGPRAVRWNEAEVTRYLDRLGRKGASDAQ